MGNRSSVHKVPFDVNPFAIPPKSIRKQSDYPTSSGGLGDVWKCSMTINPPTPATSIEVAVKTIRIADIRIEETIQKAEKRLRREVAVWIKLRHAHVLTLHGTVSGFGPLPALVSTWMQNGALNGYLERTSLAMEQKLKLLKQVVDGLRYLHERGVIHGDLTNKYYDRRRWQCIFGRFRSLGGSCRERQIVLPLVFKWRCPVVSARIDRPTRTRKHSG
jgi:serine/threonine protein kinase